MKLRQISVAGLWLRMSATRSRFDSKSARRSSDALTLKTTTPRGRSHGRPDRLSATACAPSCRLQSPMTSACFKVSGYLGRPARLEAHEADRLLGALV
ncbi:hypothetical protein J2X67_005437 [Variovorax sp. 3319]|nr:hypothetical protein [Variovorax sp. 3319]